MSLQVLMFPCLADNYGYLLHEPESGQTAAIDTPDVTAIGKALEDRHWTLTHIFNTHHHWDHAGGNLALKNDTGCTIYGPAGEAERIPGIDRRLENGEQFDFAGHAVHVLHTPGHTLGHIVYHLPEETLAFVGDTLFSLGCGRLFEGTPAQMHASLQRLAGLPEETRVYCAHEYTEANGRFARTVEPGNRALQERCRQVRRLRARADPTLPSTIAQEKKTNPFLRTHSEEIQRSLNMIDMAPVDIFTRIRRMKDSF